MKLASAILIIFFSVFNCLNTAFALKIGDEAPKVIGVNQAGKNINFSDIYDHNKFTMIYFYPKADTPGCTNQAKSLRDDFGTLQKRGVYVLGVSTDKIEDQKHFADKYTLPFDLIADDSKKIVTAFNVPTTLGYASRQAYLVYKNKIIWLDEHASTTEQSKDLLKALDAFESKSK